MNDHHTTVALRSTPSTLGELSHWTTLGLLLASAMGGLLERGTVVQESTGHLPTGGVAEVVLHVSAVDVVRAIAEAHDRLLARTHELDQTGRDVLYEDLWDLYIT